MEQRLQELKTRKKACKQAKRKFVTLRKTFSFCWGILAILLTLLALAAWFRGDLVAGWLTALGLDLQLGLLVRIFHWAAAGMWLLTLLFVILWFCGKRKWKQSAAYLDYRTIRNVMKQEKQML